NRIPGFRRQFLLGVKRFGHMPEVDLGQVADLVIVIEHHAAVAGHTEVLQQHVAGKDIGRRQFLDGLAVIDQRFADLGFAGMFQVDVQRGHASLGPALADQYGLALVDYRRRSDLQQLLQAFRLEAAAGEAEVGKVLGVGHASDPVVPFHQSVFLDDGGPAYVLGRSEPVLDDLEHRIETGEGEYRHDHAAYPGGHDESVLGVARHVIDQRTVELRLALLVETQGGVELGDLLAGQQALEKADHLHRHRDIHHEIGTGKGE